MSARGFTLIEVLMVSVLLIVVSAAVLTTFLTGQASYLSSDVSMQVQEQGRRAFDIMVRELREAGNTVTANGAQIDFRVALGYDLALAGCADDAICWGARDASQTPHPGWSVRYRVSGTQLLRELFNAGGVEQVRDERVLANLVNPGATAFTWDNVNRVVTVTLGLRRQSSLLPGGQAVGDLTTRVKLRNPS